ncbi:MAG TPA: Crp/Fnr family transcriptional regulator [Pyrinomonadaceae bacterium]|nr:Crp/Fnr family transcriptional regulator [Pyrinomonadaceae bacterium]
MLDSLPSAEYARLSPHLESINVAQGRVLTDSDQWISHVYFPTSALVALLVHMEDGATVGTGLVGAEGVVHLPVFWGEERSSYSAVVLQEGHALRMRVDVFRREVQHTAELQKSLMGYSSFAFNCAAQRIACNRLHSLKQRVASWLLGLCDLLGREMFYATHELVAELLGMRRAGVTEVVNGFKQDGALRSGRGRIEITDLRKLEESACECYQFLRGELDRFRDVRASGVEKQRAAGTQA